jgi:hypothetical protein
MIRVFLAEDMQILRDTLVTLLALEEDIEVVAQLSDGTRVVDTAVGLRPERDKQATVAGPLIVQFAPQMRARPMSKW